MKEFFADNKRLKSAIAGVLAILSSLGIDWAADIDPIVMATAIGSITTVISVYIGGQSHSDTKGKGMIEAQANASVAPIIPPPVTGA
jgi:hypothetical protein